MTKESLVGTWKLVSMALIDDKGEVGKPLPFASMGLLIYGADGGMMVVITIDGRKPLLLSTFPPSVEESAEAFRTLVGAYAGTYTVAGDKVIHHIEIAWIQNFANTDQVRTVKLEGNRLTLRGGWVLNGAAVGGNGELVWERLKPETDGK